MSDRDPTPFREWLSRVDPHSESTYGQRAYAEHAWDAALSAVSELIGMGYGGADLHRMVEEMKEP